MIPLTMRPLPPHQLNFICFDCPRCPVFPVLHTHGLSVDSVSAVFKNDWFSGSSASLPLIGAMLWGGLIMNQTAVETVSAPVWTRTLVPTRLWFTTAQKKSCFIFELDSFSECLRPLEFYMCCYWSQQEASVTCGVTVTWFRALLIKGFECDTSVNKD